MAQQMTALGLFLRQQGSPDEQAPILYSWAMIMNMPKEPRVQ